MFLTFRRDKCIIWSSTSQVSQQNETQWRKCIIVKNMNNAEKNSYVKEHITNSLLEMIHHQPLTQISVRDLCKEAGVGRASFYRNYETKEDVLTAHMIKQWREYEKTHRLKDFKIDDLFRVQRYFDFCYSLRSLNDILISQNQSGIILRAYEIILPNLDQDEPTETFALSYMAYGLFGVFVKWAKGGYIHTPEEMAKIVITEIFKDYQVEEL